MKRAWVVPVAVAVLGTPIAHGESLDVSALAAGCASCHQRGQQLPPPLHGQSAETLLAKLVGFRDGRRAGTVMPKIANGYSPAELQALARYFAAQSVSQ